MLRQFPSKVRTLALPTSVATATGYSVGRPSSQQLQTMQHSHS